MGKAKQYLVVILSALFAVIAIFLGNQYANREVPKQVTKAPTEVVKTDEKGQKKATSLFLDADHVFLASDISDKKVESLKESAFQQEDGELSLLNQAVEKWAIQKQLNQLFDAPVLTGDQLNEKAKFANGVTEANKQMVLDKLANAGINDGFSKKVRQALKADAAGKEVALGSQAAQRAQETLNLVVSEGQVVPDFTMEGYTNARDAINSLEQGEDKETLLKELRIVEEAMTNMGIDF